MRNILLLTALSMLLTIGCNNSNNAEQQEDNTVADSLEMARQDSVQKAEAEAKLNEEREAGQGGLACCDLWGRIELDTTERLN